MKVISLVASALLMHVACGVNHKHDTTLRRRSEEGGGGGNPFRKCFKIPVQIYNQDLFAATYDYLSSVGISDVPFFSTVYPFEKLGLLTAGLLVQPSGNCVGGGSLQLSIAGLPGPTFGTQINFQATCRSPIAAITGGSLLASGVSGFLFPIINPDGRVSMVVAVFCGADLAENQARFGVDGIPSIYMENDINFANGTLAGLAEVDGYKGLSDVLSAESLGDLIAGGTKWGDIFNTAE